MIACTKPFTSSQELISQMPKKKFLKSARKCKYPSPKWLAYLRWNVTTSHNVIELQDLNTGQSSYLTIEHGL